MTSSDDEIYSIMFSSLKHPARRKILRMLADKQMTFSQMLDGLGVSSSHLTYHLENLGELLSKAENGHYKLSTFGEAAVTTMKIVEEAPAVPSKHHWSLPFRWKAVIALFTVITVLMASMFCVQYVSLTQLSREHELLKLEYDRLLSWSAGTDEVTRFLETVPQINITAYQATLDSNYVVPRPDLANIIEENPKYSFVSSESQLNVAFRFRNSKLSRYQMSSFEGAPIYSQPQPSSVLESAKNLMQRLRTYEDYSYLEDMSNMLASVKTLENTEVTSGNIKLRITVSGAATEITWVYVENGIEFQAKSLIFVFENRDLKELSDGWFLFTIGSTAVNISSDEAIETARDYVKTYKWTAGGVEVSNVSVLDDPVSCVLYPHVRENSLALIPYWYVTLYLDNVYPGGVDRISIGLWADTGQVAHVRTLSG
jgi:DNA-binding transcriptional ArsR family regulator